MELITYKKIGFLAMVENTIAYAYGNKDICSAIICFKNASKVNKQQLQHLPHAVRLKYLEALTILEDFISKNINDAISNINKYIGEIYEEENPDYESMTKEQLIAILKSKCQK